MLNPEKYNELMAQLQGQAESTFRTLGGIDFIANRLEKIEMDCEGMFQDDEREFANECFQILHENAELEKAYLYRQGWKDCVSIL